MSPDMSQAGDGMMEMKQNEGGPGLANPAYESNGDVDDVKIELQSSSQRTNRGSYTHLFTYASGLDVILIFVGIIAAICHGATLPCGLIIFSDITNKFIAFGKTVGTNSTAEVPDINDEMARLALYYVGLACITLVASFLQTYCWMWTGLRQVDRIRKAFFRAVVRQDATWFDANDPGEISNRLTEDLLIIQDGVGEKIGEVMQFVARFATGIVIAFAYSWELSLVVCAVLPGLFITGAVKGKLLANWTVKEQKAYAESASIAQEVLSGIRTVVVFDGQAKEGRRYCSSLDKAEKAGISKGIGLGIGLGLFRFFMFSIYAVAFWYGSKMLTDVPARLDGGKLLLVFFSLVVGASQLGQIGPHAEAMGKAKGAAAAIFQIIGTAPEIDVFASEGATTAIEGNIEFDDVNFVYPSRDTVKVLNGLSFTVAKGKTVALIGESGCGKSTVTKLLQRCYPILSGNIKIEGVPIGDYNVNWLRQHIGVVTQEPVLFDATIRENILLGKSEAAEEEIKQAAIDANAHDFISTLPLGYDTLVGEGGAQLSGGQKQRIAIARALIRDPKILLLDEATSALDTQSEAVVQSALEKASRGRTTVVIAHRLSTIRKADCILVLVDGQVSEAGTHDELMQKKGQYFDSVMLQIFEAKGEDAIDGEGQEANDLVRATRSQSMVDMMTSIDVLAAGNEAEKKVAKSLEKALRKRMSSKKSKPKKIKKSKKTEEATDDMGDLKPVPFSRLMAMNKKEWPYILVGCLANVIVGAVPIAMSLFVSEVLKTFTFSDNQKIKKDTERLSLMLFCFALGTGFSSFIANCFLTKAGEKLTTRMRQLAFLALLKQDMSYFDDHDNSTFKLNSRLALDASRIKGVTGLRLGTLVEVSVTLLAGLTLAFVSGWQLTLLMLAFLPLIILAGMMRGRSMQSNNAKEKEKLQNVNAFAGEIIMNMRTVNSLGKEAYFVCKFVSLTLPMYNASKKDKLTTAVFAGISNSVMMFSSAATFRLGGYLVAQGKMDFHEIFRVYIAIVFAAMFAGIAFSMAPDVMKAKVSAARIFNLLDRQPLINCSSDEGDTLEKIDGNITFDKAQFSYPSRPGVSVLADFSLSIEAGTTCALVGESGSGKSTTISLVERFYDLLSGTVSVDKCDIRQLNLPWLRSQIGVVSQEPILFCGSVRDNILYGLSEDEAKAVTQDELETVAKSANIHSVISSFPQGYDTEVGGSATRMSGGQKQRIAIARALVRNPRILLLDEATSALDSGSEKVVQEALDKAMVGRTSIVVAHRLSTIQNSDVIAVVDDGQIIEKGTHMELLDKKGAYYLLNRTQVE